MFGNNQQQDDQTNNTNMDQVAEEIGNPAQPVATPAFGLGSNPTSFSPISAPPSSPTPPPTTEEITAPLSAPEPPAEIITPQRHQTDNSSPAPAGDLDEIKTQALQQLSPLVSKLEQSPEEKYKTLMMLIQASDNRDLIKDAYTAANSIEDEKVRAEALLSIVNEINYFTQQSHN